MDTITCLLTSSQRKSLLNAWIEFKIDKEMPYIEYQCKVENCMITSYTSGKVVFQGKDAKIYASPFVNTNEDETIEEHAGSDEVGTGDYFGPVCVCACIVKKEDVSWIKELKVNDSKQVNDDHILKIAPKLMERLNYSKLILSNDKYNVVHQSNNLNAIKAKLHNQAYINLINKGYQLPKLCVIDQFTPKTSYYKYLQNEKQVFKNLHFETKAESKYLAVACASIIARYSFLIAWQSLEDHYKMKLAKGANDHVNRDAKKFVETHGMDELKNVAKLHFKNTDLILK